MSAGFIVAMAALLALLALVSYVDRVYTEMGKFLSREFQDNIEAFEQRIEPRLGVSRARAQLSMAVLTQLSTAAIALMIGYSIFEDGRWDLAEVLEAAVCLVIIIVVFNRLLPFVFFTRTSGRWLAHFTIPLRALIYLVFPVTLVLGFALSVAALAEAQEPEEPEHPSEAVDALIEAGQEEGILEESDRRLIQSVVEFGDKTAREVMTARPDIAAVPVSMTVEKFIESQRTRPFSRMPVYDGTIDNIKGIVLAHDALQVSDSEAGVQTVEKLMRPVLFVPETMHVSTLLRELQSQNMHMAIVVDEYGGVAGVVTMEDLVEEIVGEIRDEHEAKSDIVRESDTSYIVPGTMDVDRLDELFHIRPDGREATTVAGLVSEIVGHIPQKGEVVEEGGLRYEVLDSSQRRVKRLRISSRLPQQARA
ncbi:MAG TPA: hemolysin family protein [Terriglobales bacterium]|nr:hemolysin family protein [Terriglobales bacterium]